MCEVCGGNDVTQAGETRAGSRGCCYVQCRRRCYEMSTAARCLQKGHVNAVRVLLRSERRVHQHAIEDSATSHSAITRLHETTCAHSHTRSLVGSDNTLLRPKPGLVLYFGRKRRLNEAGRRRSRPSIRTGKIWRWCNGAARGLAGFARRASGELQYVASE